MGEISEHGSKCFGLDDSESWHLILYHRTDYRRENSRMIRSLDPVDLSLSFNLVVPWGR